MTPPPTHDVTDPRPMSRSAKIAAVSVLTLLALATFSVLVALVLARKHSIASGSMLPTLFVDEFVMFAPIALAGDAVPGDVVTYENMNAVWVGRYIAGPGDRVSISNGIPRINGHDATRRATTPRDAMPPSAGGSQQVFEETLPNGRNYLVLDDPTSGPADNMAELTVAEGTVFILGDNRDNSFDSRFAQIGFIAIDALRSKHGFVYFSAGPDGVRLNRMFQLVR